MQSVADATAISTGLQVPGTSQLVWRTCNLKEALMGEGRPNDIWEDWPRTPRRGECRTTPRRTSQT